LTAQDVPAPKKSLARPSRNVVNGHSNGRLDGTSAVGLSSHRHSAAGPENPDYESPTRSNRNPSSTRCSAQSAGRCAVSRMSFLALSCGGCRPLNTPAALPSPSTFTTKVSFARRLVLPGDGAQSFPPDRARVRAREGPYREYHPLGADGAVPLVQRRPRREPR
jgi:hypothetical protein